MQKMKNKIFKVIFIIPILLWGIFYTAFLSVILAAFVLDISIGKINKYFKKRQKNDRNKTHI